MTFLKTKLSGTVKNIRFRDEETGFFIATITAGNKEHLVKGTAPLINKGERLDLEGSWGKSSWGPQFSASAVRVEPPSHVEGIITYLSSAVKGVGKGFAKKLTDALGADVFEVIENDPQRLYDIPGVGKKRADALITALNDTKAMRITMVFLHSIGLSGKRAQKVLEKLGEDPVSQINENPYLLCKVVRGIGFKLADDVAKNMGIPKTSDFRVRAGVSHVLEEAVKGGSCGLPVVMLREKAAELLNVPFENIDTAIEWEITKGSFVRDTSGEHLCIFLSSVYRAEREIGTRLLKMVHTEPVRVVQDIQGTVATVEKGLGFALEAAQREAAHLVLANNVAVLTGGPGTGKCVVEGTRILSETGFKRIEAHSPIPLDLLEPESSVDIRLHVDSHEGPAVARKFYDGGVKQVIELGTNFGYMLKGTFMHPVYVLREGVLSWVRMMDIQLGDMVAIGLSSTFRSGRTQMSKLQGDAAVTALTPQDETLPEELFTAGTQCWEGMYEAVVRQSAVYLLSVAQDLQLIFTGIGKVTRLVRTELGVMVQAVDAGFTEHGGFAFTTVTELSYIGMDQVYDLTVPGPASFFAGGLVVHNTTITKVIVNCLQAHGLRNILLCAPTGKAAKRASEATGLPGVTVHRMLGVGPNGTFKHNETNPLVADVVVMDESSMMDVKMTLSVLRALSVNTRLILIGDQFQLDSVGAGKVLADILRSGVLPRAMLTAIFRQAAKSKIKTSAHLVNSGTAPEETPYSPSSDFWSIPFDPSDPRDDGIKQQTRQRMQKYLLKVVQSMSRLGYDIIRDCQVLAPMRKGALGVDELNLLLQDLLNPNTGNYLQTHSNQWRPNDKVMQVRNNYEKGVFNGDIGFIAEVNMARKELTVEYDEITVTYDLGELDELRLAYAFTIHKSQGSEFPVVIMPLDNSHYQMLKRNLVYTGLTRARKQFVLLYNTQALRTACKNVQSDDRYTRLYEWLTAGLPKEMLR